MKKLLLSYCLIYLSISALAQTIDANVVYKDTINLRGFVYGLNDIPIKNIQIESRQKDLTYNKYPLITHTDSTGFFELKGAKPNDTLRIFDHLYYYKSFFNRGSRFMIIYLPQPDAIANINSDHPIEITAKRKILQIIPSFHLAEDNILDGYCSVMMAPSFPNGQEKFIDYIKQRVTYPENAIKHNIEGTIEISFVIERDGSLNKIKTLKGLGYSCDEQIIEILKKSPKWRPGIFCGRLYALQETISVQFKLIDK